MIYVTGDTHGDTDFFKLFMFSVLNDGLTREDYVIIAGDFGGIWSKEKLEEDLAPYEKLPFTVLFVDGNHENFDLLESYPTKEWKGGLIREIKPNIFHLTRGQVFTIEGKKIFTFGGATSVDKWRRVEGESWWARELPDETDLFTAVDNLEKHNFTVDYIITHSCDEKAFYMLPYYARAAKTGVSPEVPFLSYFEDRVEYKHWYFGHFHLDKPLSDKKTVLYQEIVPIDQFPALKKEEKKEAKTGE